MKTSKVLSIFAVMAPCTFAFVGHRVPDSASSTCRGMVGGRGWDNSDFLSGLSGDDDVRQKAAEDYNDFSERRRAFLMRQMETMKTPEGKAFLEQQQMRAAVGDDMPIKMPDQDIMNVQAGSGGGSRMAQMMAQAKKMKDMKEQMKEMGFEQKFAVPLDDDEEEEENDK